MKEWTYDFEIYKHMALAGDSSGWLCLVFADHSSDSKVCSDVYTLPKNAIDIGDEFEVDLSCLLDPVV